MQALPHVAHVECAARRRLWHNLNVQKQPRDLRLGLSTVMALASLAAGPGCGSTSAGDAGGGSAPDAPAAPQSGVQLHVGPWAVAPGEEINRCVVAQVEKTLLVNGIESWAGQNVHHFRTDATIANVPLGDHDCAEIFTQEVMANSITLYSTTKAHERIDFPKGTAGQLPRGFVTLIMSYHYLNTSADSQTVEGYLNLETTTRDQVETLINGLVGTYDDFELPPLAKTSLKATCNIDRPIDVIALTSHAHDLLTSFEIRLVRQGNRPAEPDHFSDDGRTSILKTYIDAPVRLEPGDQIEWICSYDNPTDLPVREGEGAADEMCKAIVVYVPDQGALACNATREQEVVTPTQTAPPADF